MSELLYTKDHEWIRLEDDQSLTVGITPYAQEQLGDIVFIELPEVGAEVTAGDEVVVIESVKAASDIKIPVSGRIVAVNDSLDDAPETVNSDPLQAGWFLRIAPSEPIDTNQFLDKNAYDELTGD